MAVLGSTESILVEEEMQEECITIEFFLTSTILDTLERYTLRSDLQCCVLCRELHIIQDCVPTMLHIEKLAILWIVSL